MCRKPRFEEARERSLLSEMCPAVYVVAGGTVVYAHRARAHNCTGYPSPTPPMAQVTSLDRMLLLAVTQGDNNITALIQPGRIGGNPTVAKQGRAADQVKPPGMQGADDAAAAHEPIGQWPAAMRAPGLRGIDRAAARVKNGDPPAVDIEHTPFADRNPRQRAKDVFCREICHGRLRSKR